MINYINYFKKGGIHIKPKNKGKFTETKKMESYKKHSIGGIINYFNYFKQ